MPRRLRYEEAEVSPCEERSVPPDRLLPLGVVEVVEDGVVVVLGAVEVVVEEGGLDVVGGLDVLVGLDVAGGLDVVGALDGVLAPPPGTPAALEVVVGAGLAGVGDGLVDVEDVGDLLDLTRDGAGDGVVSAVDDV